MDNNIDDQLIILDSASFLEHVEETSFENTKYNKDDFQYVKISDVKISNKSLRRSEFNFSSLTNVVFDHINLEGGEFKYTTLTNVTFSYCRLNRSNFEYATLNNVTFQNCLLDTSGFDFATGNIIFNSCNIEGGEFQHTLAKIEFNDCNCNYIKIKCCPALTINANNCDFYQGELDDSTFNGIIQNSFFVETSFNNSNGTNLQFNECKIREVDTHNSTGFSLVTNDDNFDDLDL